MRGRWCCGKALVRVLVQLGREVRGIGTYVGSVDGVEVEKKVSAVASSLSFSRISAAVVAARAVASEAVGVWERRCARMA